MLVIFTLFLQTYLVCIATILILNAAVNASPLGTEETEINSYDVWGDLQHFITTFGPEAVDFLNCMGPTFLGHCAKSVIQCSEGAQQNVPSCIQAIVCEGQDASKCAQHLKVPENRGSK